MRIGEVAALVGVTPRAVRHYHQLGLLPEPLRRSNGCRAYGTREAVLLARIRRLTAHGLGLDDLRDALVDTEGHDVSEVLRELDAALARQEVVTRQRRTTLAPLLVQAQGPGPCLLRDRCRPSSPVCWPLSGTSTAHRWP
ncbi:MerR family transcriptional regulator [Streptomyces sp. NPDC055749]